MLTQHHLDNSFVHGALAFLIYALGPFIHSQVALMASGIVCVYAGWLRQARLALFVGGVVVAVVAWGIVVGLHWMVPFALPLILAIALALYLLGKVFYLLTHRRPSIEHTNG